MTDKERRLLGFMSAINTDHQVTSLLYALVLDIIHDIVIVRKKQRMDIIKFKECNVVYAENQEEYLKLPAHRNSAGCLTTCWKPNLFERLQILFTGKIWLQILTFNKPLQPLRMQTEKPKLRN